MEEIKTPRSGRSDTYWSVTGRGGGVSAQISPGSHRASTGPSQAYALYQGMAFSRAVGGSQFRALAPAACFLARYANQYGNSSATRPVRSSIASRSCHHQGLKPYAFRGSARLKPCPDTNQIITSRSRKLRASTRVSTRHAISACATKTQATGDRDRQRYYATFPRPVTHSTPSYPSAKTVRLSPSSPGQARLSGSGRSTAACGWRSPSGRRGPASRAAVRCN